MCRIAGYSPGEAPSESVRRGHVNGVGVAQSHGLHAARRLRESANRCTALRRSVERNGHESQAGKDKITKISTGSIVIAVWGTRPPRERRAVHGDTASPLRVFRRGYRGSLTGANCGQRPTVVRRWSPTLSRSGPYAKQQYQDATTTPSGAGPSVRPRQPRGGRLSHNTRWRSHGPHRPSLRGRDHNPVWVAPEPALPAARSHALTISGRPLRGRRGLAVRPLRHVTRSAD